MSSPSQSSQPPPARRATTSLGGFARVSALRGGPSLQSIPESGTPNAQRRPTIGGTTGSRSLSGPPSSFSSGQALSKPATTIAAPPKSAQRTTKTSQKLVVLPSEVQTAPLPVELGEDETPSGPPRRFASQERHHEHRSEGERMTKAERQRSGYRRLTAYCVAESFRTKLLLAYLKREHGVTPRVYDEAVYAVYHLPLLPGYGPNVNLRSSAAPRSPEGGSILTHLSDAEDLGYDGTYFATSTSPEQFSLLDGYISGSPPVPRKLHKQRSMDEEPPFLESETEVELPTDVEAPLFDEPFIERLVEPSPPAMLAPSPERKRKLTKKRLKNEEDTIAEMIVFDYGVVVFLGFEETQERDALEDLDRAMIGVRTRSEDRWEVESCHFVYDPSISSPRIYNDFFTFKAHSHLMNLSLAHAMAQSVLLGLYESNTQTVLSSGQTMAIPKQLADTGELKLGRSEALRMTGRLFKLRRDVNLSSNLLDTPELFWSEASLKNLYQACREYFEIDSRVASLNQKLSVTSELLDIIHDHLNNGAMIRITWIIIWLIVVACLVELGEVIARLMVGGNSGAFKLNLNQNVLHTTNTIEDPLRVLDRLMSTEFPA